MKKIILIHIILFSTILLYSQNSGKIPLYLRIEDSWKMPLAFTDVILKDVKTGVEMKKRTNGSARVKFFLYRGMTYSVSFKNKKNHTEIEVAEKGVNFLRKTIVYDPPEGVFSLSNPPDTIYQRLPKSQQSNATESIFKLQLIDMKKRRLKYLPIKIFSKKLNKVFVSKTDNYGQVVFLMPPGDYIISIENLDNFKQFKHKKDTDGFVLTKIMVFEPTRIKETIKNDTITQKLKETFMATSSRVSLRVFVRDYNKKLLENEDVFLNVVGSNLVFHTKTNSKGQAMFLLPKGDSYILSFKYERDIDMLSYPSENSIFNTRIRYSYMGSDNIETFYKTTKRDKNGFLTEFMKSKTSPTKLKNDVLQKTKKGFNINFPSQSPVGTPAIGNGNMYVGGGYYTRTFFCFDAKTGKNKWGVSLADGGPSSAVYSDGVVLINTQSCTLYAFDANTGNLLWSKWLGPNIYSTPTVANGTVFAVYPNSLGGIARRIAKTNPGNEFVLAAFDLRDGKIKWQAWIDKEVLASPVYYDNNVYLTSMAGTLYKFDANTGEMKRSLNKNFVSPPTIKNNLLYVSVKKDTLKQVVAICSNKDFSLIKKITKLRGLLPFKKAHDISSSELMNFNGSRITNYKGKNYNIIGGRLYCTNEKNGALIWSKRIAQSTNVKDYTAPKASLPIIANGKLIIATRSGIIKIYNPFNGRLIKQYNTHNRIYTQPAVHNGWIYTGTQEGKIISIDTKNKSYTGWPMWNRNSTHNSIVD